jgi:colanic acid/amylovoran biosynthesis glycosyltransferase
MGRSVIFINSVFPCLSETFVFDQYDILKEAGLSMLIVSNNHPASADVHPRMRAIQSQVDYLCDATLLEILVAHLSAFWRAPGRYLKSLARIPSSNDSLRATLGQVTGAALVLHRYCRVNSPLLHAHFTYGAAAVALWAKRIGGVPYVLTLHGSDVNFDNPPDLISKLGEADALVSISQFNIDFLHSKYPTLALPKVTVLPLGVPAKPAPVSTAPVTGVLRLITVGRLSNHKAQHILIEACALLEDRGVPFTCRIVGEGPLRPMLESLVAEHKLEGKLQLLGARFHDEVLEFYGDADLFVLCSVAEGMPIVLMEAMRAGLPIVSTSIGAIPEMVQDAGVLIPPNDSIALANVIEEFANGKRDTAHLKKRGAEIVATQFDLRTNHLRLRAFLES